MTHKHSYSAIAEKRMKTSNDPKKAQESVSLLDEMVLNPMMLAHPERYWAWRRADHELYNGAHYDEAFAMWEVSRMHHTDKSGVVHHGEHWSIETVMEVYTAKKATLKPTDTVYDFYVALHSWWHDNICQDNADFGAEAEAKNIERAINYFFMDEDAPDGKIWHYYKGMRNCM